MGVQAWRICVTRAFLLRNFASPSFSQARLKLKHKKSVLHRTRAAYIYETDAHPCWRMWGRLYICGILTHHLLQTETQSIACLQGDTCWLTQMRRRPISDWDLIQNMFSHFFINNSHTFHLLFIHFRSSAWRFKLAQAIYIMQIIIRYHYKNI